MINFDEGQYYDYVNLKDGFKEIDGGGIRDLIMKLIVMNVHRYDAIYIEDFGTTVNILEKDETP